MKYSTVSYLAHHGIEGQKWGVRRWQNKDGSLTPEGRAHYGIGEDTIAKGHELYKKAYSDKSYGRKNIDKIKKDKLNFITSNMQKLDKDDPEKSMYREYEGKFNKRWDEQNKNKSDKELMKEYDWNEDDIEHLKADGYGDNVREVIRSWEWLHGYEQEWIDYDRYREANKETNERNRQIVEDEIYKAADMIYGTQEMIAKVEKGKRTLDNLETAFWVGTGLTILGGTAGLAVANKNSAKKDPNGEGFLERWAKR